MKITLAILAMMPFFGALIYLFFKNKDLAVILGICISIILFMAGLTTLMN